MIKYRGEKMGITVCTVSGKGGTGKSTVCSGLAIAAANKGGRVLLIDLDSGLRCLDTIFGIDDGVVFDLSDSIREFNSGKALYKAANYDNIFIIPAPASAEAIDFEKLRLIVDSLKESYDYIFLDFPSGVDFDAYNKFKDSLFLIVSGSDDVSTKAAGVISSGISSDTDVRLIINRFDRDMISAGFYKNIDDVIDRAGARLIGIVPADGELLLLSRNHKIKPKGRAAKAFDRIIRRISKENVPLVALKKI